MKFTMNSELLTIASSILVFYMKTGRPTVPQIMCLKNFENVKSRKKVFIL
jgi:hypothetical protein